MDNSFYGCSDLRVDRWQCGCLELDNSYHRRRERRLLLADFLEESHGSGGLYHLVRFVVLRGFILAFRLLLRAYSDHYPSPGKRDGLPQWPCCIEHHSNPVKEDAVQDHQDNDPCQPLICRSVVTRVYFQHPYEYSY